MIFNSLGDVTITGQGYTRQSWPLISLCSLTCHTYYYTCQHFIMVISEEPWHSHLLPSVWRRSCHNLFLRIMSVRSWDRTQTSCMRSECSTTKSSRRYPLVALCKWKTNANYKCIWDLIQKRFKRREPVQLCFSSENHHMQPFPVHFVDRLIAVFIKDILYK